MSVIIAKVSPAHIVTQHDSLLSVVATVDGQGVVIGQDIHDPEVADRLVRGWDASLPDAPDGARS